ncbi:MAG TPA: GntR family transcriptional regulator [Agrococcus sp.]|nr:GntR family transcriptional regulator [Agrococcus sp.]
MQGTTGARQSTVLPVARPSTVDLIAAELREAIYSGALGVGTGLGEVETAAQLGVSRGPFREAAQRLVQEGLLTAVPGRGLRVSVIGREHVADLYGARIAVETEAARQIVAGGRSLDDVQAALDVLERVSERDDALAIGDADLDFHRRLVAASGNRRLTRYMATLAIETRIASLSAADGYAVRRSVSPTYRALLDALAAGDADAAVAAIRQQLEEATGRLLGLVDGVETVERDVVPPPLQPIDPAQLGDAPPTL